MIKKTIRACAAAMGALVVTLPAPTYAYETGYPGFLLGPGSFVNSPATTPPPGLYGSIISDFAGQTLRGPGAPIVNGNPVPANVLAGLEFLSYVPGFKIGGGDYSITLGQQESYVNIGAPVNKVSSGVHNTNITNSLGFRVTDNLFAKIHLSVFIPDGTIRGANDLGNIGFPFFGFIPRLTTTYSMGRFTFNNNIDGEFTTANRLTGYQNGNVLRETASVTATFGRLTLGPAVEYIGQITGDKSTAFYKYAINTNRYNQLALGGIVGYDFGPVAVAVYGLNQVTANASGGTPRFPGGPDSATTTGGYSVIAQISFKFPGIGGLGQPVDFGALTTPVRH